MARICPTNYSVLDRRRSLPTKVFRDTFGGILCLSGRVLLLPVVCLKHDIIIMAAAKNSYIPAPIITFENKRVGQVVEVVQP